MSVSKDVFIIEVQNRLAIGQGVKILDQKIPGGEGGSTNPSPASLRVNLAVASVCLPIYIASNGHRLYELDTRNICFCCLH